MQRIGEEAVRLFKALAGQERDEPLSSPVFALYTFLFMVAMVVFGAWVGGAQV